MLAVSYIGGLGRGLRPMLGPTTPSAWLNSLSAATLKSYLNHALVPVTRAKAVTFANVTTLAQAQVYAEKGFHAAVDRGWAAPAAVYFASWQDVKAGVTDMARLRTWLAFANKLSDEARASRPGTTPIPAPKPPVTQEVVVQGEEGSVAVTPQTGITPPEPAKAAVWPWLLGGGAVVGAIVYLKKRRKKSQ